MSGEYSEKEIEDYEKEARREWKTLKLQLKENPKLVLILDRKTERYIPYTDEAKIIQFPM